MGIGMELTVFIIWILMNAAMSYETDPDLLIPLTVFLCRGCFATFMLAVSALMHCVAVIIF